MTELIFLDSIVKMPLLELPVRSVLVPLRTGRVLISPGSQLTVAQLGSLGEVTDIVAPSLLHTGGVKKAADVFPQAKLWGPSGVRSDISYTHELPKQASDPWPHRDELSPILIQGMSKVNEFVFFHHETRSLIVSDLCFNLIDAKGLGAWIILNLFGTYKKLGVSRFFLKYVEDKNAFNQSLDELFRTDFDRILVGHGNNVLVGAKAQLKAAFQERGYLLH